MIIYIAALNSNGYKHTQRYEKLNDHERAIVNGLPDLLESYHYVHKQSFVDAMRKQGDRIFVDSGAFSAYTLGATIDLPTYVNYILENKDIIRVDDGLLMASVLDGIGDPLLTYQNQLHMERLGVTPLPCFHFLEDERYLEYYMQNYDYITIGGMVGKSKPALTEWLDYIWNDYLTDGSGNPRVKTHAFGITALPLIERYPWYSCDSSSWIQAAAYGNIITPDYGFIGVSSESATKHNMGAHVSTLDSVNSRVMMDHLTIEAGFEYERLQTVYESRAVYNCWAAIKTNSNINDTGVKTFSSPIQRLFH